MPGATQALDLCYGRDFISTVKAKIVDGVLISYAADYLMPYRSSTYCPTVLQFRGLKFELRLTEDSAEGVMGGYVDIDSWRIQRQVEYIDALPELRPRIGARNLQSCEASRPWLPRSDHGP